ncbi:hypothetical protein C8N47_106198 [Mangrovibacterium marinum]|uniref:Uncharacterized protein n=1 Tax=Mangrovibacterium marinum TaxID=1639118 RepID=A0A2T5C309_9BACT|nr:hypothetical protein C8N47_106198 [Mangrovibacterium marinum]
MKNKYPITGVALGPGDPDLITISLVGALNSVSSFHEFVYPYYCISKLLLRGFGFHNNNTTHAAGAVAG